MISIEKGEVQIERGVCLGFGGSNARVATCADSDIYGFEAVETPSEPNLFFSWMARNLLNASHKGNGWLVAGFPGLVSPDGKLVGPLNNVSGMREEQYNLREQLVAADTEVERVIDQGFILLPVNDGTLAAQAAASRIGEHQYDKTGALIIGTGVGAGVVKRDANYLNVHRTDNSNPYEIGHIVLSGDPLDRAEDNFSGPGMEARYGACPKDLPPDHPAWEREGEAIGRLATLLGIMNGVDLVVPTGGVGIGGSTSYSPHLTRFMENYKRFGNGAQKMYTPEIKLVSPAECDEFEMYGAEGAIRDHLAGQHD